MVEPGTECTSVVSVVHGGVVVAICVGRCFCEMEVGGFGWAEFPTWESPRAVGAVNME